MLLSGGMLTWLSVARYQGYNAGMLDLGNMSQAIASVQRGAPLIFTYKDGATSRLAMHVEIIYYLLAPFYALWPDPRTLLVLQAGLFAFGAIPVYRLALRQLNNAFAARCLALAYLLYPTAQTSVLFDLHGDTLAMPILLFALDALDQRAWWRYGLFITLALSCKFYVAAAVALLGPVIWVAMRTRRAAVVTTTAGVVYGFVAFAIIRPLFTTAQTSSAHRGLSYLSFYFGQMSELLGTWDQRMISALVVFGPALFLAWRGWRWLLPAAPIALAALLSTGPGGAYDYRYHHYALVVPFVIRAVIAGAAQMKHAQERRVSIGFGARRSARTWRGDVILTLLCVALLNVALVDTPLNPLFWLRLPGQGLDAAVYGRIPRDALKDQFVGEVPPTAPLAASNFLAPHLVNRDTLYLLRYPDEPTAGRLAGYLPQVQIAVADALFDFVTPLDDGSFAGGIDYDADAIRQLLQAPGWSLTTARDGLLRFERTNNRPGLQQSIQQVTDSAPAQAQFGNGIDLVRSTITPDATNPRRFHANFRWRVTSAFDPSRQLVAVSTFGDDTTSRIVHLPSYVLQPTSTWQPGQVWEEQFDLELPAALPPGQATWRTAWYDVSNPFAPSTDERSRVGQLVDVMVLGRR